MFQYIEKLRQKPSYTRRRMAFFVTLMLFVLVVLVWWLTLDTSQKESKNIDIEKNTPSPFKVLKDVFGDISNDAKAKIEAVKKPLYNGN